MMVRKLIGVGAPGALVLALAAVAGPPVPGQQPAGRAPGGVSPATQKSARQLVEKTRDFENLLTGQERSALTGNPRDVAPGERVYFTKAEATAEKDEGGTRDVNAPPKTVVLTYYRYKTDEAIVTTVNVADKTVLKIEHIPHLPTPLADVEVADAQDLAMKDPEVKKALQGYGDKVDVSVLVPQVGKDDPKFGHRLVVLMFRVGKDYLVSPRVTVDLTEQTVKVDKLKLPPGLDNKGH